MSYEPRLLPRLKMWVRDQQLTLAGPTTSEARRFACTCSDGPVGIVNAVREKLPSLRTPVNRIWSLTTFGDLGTAAPTIHGSWALYAPTVTLKSTTAEMVGP